MTEHDLFDAIGNINNKYIKNAEQADSASAQHQTIKGSKAEGNTDDLVLDIGFDAQENTPVTPMKRSRVMPNVITAILVSAAVLVAFFGGAYAYKMFHKADTPVVGIGDTKPATEAEDKTTAIDVANNDTSCSV